MAIIKFNNPKAYKTMPVQQIKLEVIVQIDPSPGAFHQVDDHIRWLLSMGYIQSVAVEEAFIKELPYQFGEGCYLHCEEMC